MLRGYTLIGVDPGSPAYLSWMSRKGRLLELSEPNDVATPTKAGMGNTPHKIAALIEGWQARSKSPVVGVIEHVSGRQHEGIRSATKFVGSMWAIEGVFAALRIPYIKVVPRKWQADVGLTSLAKQTYGGDTKEASLSLSRKLWPNRSHLMRRKKDHNRSDAALIAYWGLMHGTEERIQGRR